MWDIKKSMPGVEQKRKTADEKVGSATSSTYTGGENGDTFNY